MKVDTSRLKKGTSEVPPECQILIDKLKGCDRNGLIEELSKIETWTFGKCELFHWIEILDIFDEILEEATHYEGNQIYIMCDSQQFEKVWNNNLLLYNKFRKKIDNFSSFSSYHHRAANCCCLS
jgi:E3 ubiquitin-protein ligase HUWE1